MLKKGVERNSLNVYLSLTGSFGEYFLFYGLAKFYIYYILYIYCSGLKAYGLLVPDSISLPLPVISAVVSIYLITSTTVPQIPVLLLRPEFGTRFAPSVHDDISLQN